MLMKDVSLWPPNIKEHRRDREALDQLEIRAFFNNEKLINHVGFVFESARGSQRGEVGMKIFNED
jgi:hypothetical protein